MGYAFSLSRDFPKACGQRVLWLNRREFLMEMHHLANFSGHRHWGSRDITSLAVEE